MVANGLTQIVTNFGKMAGQLSGPVAIVAAGSEIARVDSAGLFQVRWLKAGSEVRGSSGWGLLGVAWGNEPGSGL